MARFVVSTRLAGKTHDAKKALRDALGATVINEVPKFAKVLASHSPDIPGARWSAVFEGDAGDVEEKRKEWGSDVLIEPEILRTPMLSHPLATLRQVQGASPLAAGVGSSFSLTLTGSGNPLAGVSVTLILSSPAVPQGTRLEATTDPDGKVSWAFDPSAWTPVALFATPASGFWSWWLNSPTSPLTLDIPPLPQTGPVALWHQLLGMQRYADSRGAGIRIGVVDTGVGPHPYLSHANVVGAFLNGTFQADAASGADVENHGTHVSGIIGARPPEGSHDFGGIAAGAGLYVARVFPPGGGGATQIDIANAIDHLAMSEQVDLINLSVGGPQPSNIELDALITALEVGTVTICAAGNTNGGPVSFPASYPQAVAISAVGVLGAVPAGSLDSTRVPTQPDRFGPGGLYLANFSSIGPQITATGPGVGIISTVPGQTGAPYAVMSGTSMASPAVCAALATALGSDPAYLATPRDATRARAARLRLAQTLRTLGLNPIYQGGGLATAMP